MYEILLFVHVLSAILWIGGVAALLWTVRDARAREGAAGADPTLERVERLLMVYIAGPLLVVVSGIAMVIVSDAWSFSQPWVYLALGLFVVGAAVFSTASGAETQIKAARAAGTVASAEYAGLQSRFLNRSGLATAILAAVVILMVFKPGI